MFFQKGHSKSVYGFTLVEVMIVVAIIGLLAVIALPGFKRARYRAQNNKFAHDARMAGGAFVTYALDHGEYPPDTQPGRLPGGMESYLENMKWTTERPLGGRWDWDYQAVGYGAAVSAQGIDATDEQLEILENEVDDGNRSTGLFQIRASRVSYIME